MSFEVTGLVIAKNEEVDLPQALKQWQPVYNQLVVVDDDSSDSTREIARTYGAKVVDTCMDETGFAGLRNSGLEVVETSHVLVFDADERPTERVLQSIHNAISVGRQETAYRFLRRTNVFGGWIDHGRFSSDWQIRLFSSSARYEGAVHELPILKPNVEFLDLEGIVEHYTYRSLGEYITKMRMYAEKLAPNHQPPTLGEVVKIGHRNLIKNQGYKDGWRGLAMATGDIWNESMLRRHGLKCLEAAQSNTAS